ncbi:MAG: 50S ribosomal protein L32 [Chlamydia sp.]
MAVPRNRHSNARKNSKRSHHAKTPKNFGTCTNCSVQKMPHVVCHSCGWYKGRQVVQVEKSGSAA